MEIVFFTPVGRATGLSSELSRLSTNSTILPPPGDAALKIVPFARGSTPSEPPDYWVGLFLDKMLAPLQQGGFVEL
ncbi:MAG: hypothetical protein KME30_28970 [Iphinoe sp. HA4291-MV1]|nr:hypothetical protein [Iphinoe sp. HA4291-MV1]